MCTLRGAASCSHVRRVSTDSCWPALSPGSEVWPILTAFISSVCLKSGLLTWKAGNCTASLSSVCLKRGLLARNADGCGAAQLHHHIIIFSAGNICVCVCVCVCPRARAAYWLRGRTQSRTSPQIFCLTLFDIVTNLLLLPFNMVLLISKYRISGCLLKE